MFTTVYKIDKENGVFLCEEKIWIGAGEIPPNDLVLVAPPVPGDKQVAVWDKKKWSLKPDYRGKKYWPAGAKHDDEPLEITKPGIEIPKGASLTGPEKTLDEQKKDLLFESNAYADTTEVRAVAIEQEDIIFDSRLRGKLLERYELSRRQKLKKVTFLLGSKTYRLSFEKAQSLMAAVIEHAAAVFDRKKEHAQAIAKLKTVKQISRYDFKAGYPEKTNLTQFLT